ncbi:hypothetical protein LY90DRAFT_625408 [Neocallimastix californiae]|uniref:Uncharacterized protein n=1 Tax=Neocallimastix californiae TaxID=1754190 RepID=A0A1Y2F5J4_9FUNG|nr:hypothetical protein LY90DRAFT_625408 [Neocallimastix californiae]|eukprot:ORY79129.1 hypothetical protein LY90DRAFT_625408 [Neocallimastix californiae]
MINDLKERFLETGPSRLFKIEIKIKKLEIENDDFKLYLDNLNSLLTEYSNRAKLQNKPELSEESKVLYSLEELNKVGIAYSFTFPYDEKTFKDLKEVIIKLSTIIKKSKTIKRVKIKKGISTRRSN